MSLNRLDKQVRFAVELDKLKGVLRATHLIDIDRKENTAEHSWHVALLGLVLVEYVDEEIDLLKALSMLLIHDVIEVYSGDTFVYDTDALKTQSDREEAAAEKIFGLLPRYQGRKLSEMWQEFELGNSTEARFAKALDRLLPLIQNYFSGGKTWKANDTRKSQVIARNECIALSSQRLAQYAISLIEDAVAQGMLKAD